jgi:microcystin-dependent protein
MGIIAPSLPTLNQGETEASAQPKVTNALQEILNLLNGAIDSANIAAGSITADRLAFSIQSAFIPAGIVLPTAGAAADSGFLLCDGSAVSRTTYSNLFSKIGTRWGTGDGVSTFTLPNLNSTHRTLIGADGTTIAVGATGGEETHALTVAELAAHTHAPLANGSGYIVNGGSPGLPQNYQGATAGSGSNYSSASTTGSAGSGTAHNNMPPYAAVLFQIKT